MPHSNGSEDFNSIVELPDEVLAAVINSLMVYARGNPGDVCRLMLVKDLAQLIEIDQVTPRPHVLRSVLAELHKAESSTACHGPLLVPTVPEAGLAGDFRVRLNVLNPLVRVLRCSSPVHGKLSLSC